MTLPLPARPEESDEVDNRAIQGQNDKDEREDQGVDGAGGIITSAAETDYDHEGIPVPSTTASENLAVSSSTNNSSS